MARAPKLVGDDDGLEDTLSRSQFSIGWTVVSYFMVLGGILVMLAVLGLAKVESAPVIWVGAGAGAAFGGFIAGRSSPHKAILEPAIAGVLVLVSFLGIFSLVPGSRAIWRLADDAAILNLILVGAIFGAGGLVGGVLGEKTAPEGVASRSRVRWMGVAALITTGVFAVLMMLMMILIVRKAADGGAVGENMGVGLMLLMLALTAFLGGAITQAIAPERMLVPCGAGFLVLMFVVFGISAAQTGGQGMGQAFGGLMFVGLIGLGVGTLGAAVGWGFVKDKHLAQQGEIGQVFE
jgi:hypothetical protein